MNPIYRHKLTIGAKTYDVHPVYKDDMALDYQHESGEQFFRANLSGKMDFVGADASLIIGAPFTTEYIFTIECSIDGGITWTTFHVSKFYQTDCTIDVDDLKVTVKPNVKDRYQKVLDGMEKEYNLIDLLPVIEPIRMAKRGVIQIYGSGEDIVTNIYSGMSWEQDFDLSDRNPADYHFNSVSNRIEMSFGDNPPAGLEGTFTGIADADGNFRLENGLGVYYIVRYEYSSMQTHTDIVRYSDGEEIWRNINDTGLAIEFFRIGASYDTIQSSGYRTDIYARLLCDVASFVYNGTTYNTYGIAGDDPSYGGNYHYVIGYNTHSLVQSTRTSTTPTKWGRKNQQEYFNTPSDTYQYIPVGRSLWVNYSFWYLEEVSDIEIEVQSRKNYYLKDSYPLYSVIQVLLDKLETGVTFEGTAVYSQFLYGTNPLDRFYDVLPYITPKSNIIKGEYKDPASKAPITLAMIFGILRKAFGCYWFIDEQMKLHIEHISYFKNGGAYGGTHQVGIDLTAIHQPTNGKPWSFDTSNYQYDKEQMPARYQYGWMDDCTDIFDGKPINVVSTFVQTDKVEEINISNFSSDVDYMTIAPDNFSKDGFVLLMAKTDTQTGDKYLPIFIYQDAEYHEVHVQNWYASLQYLILRFLRSDLPTWTFNYGDDTDYLAFGIQRQKKQQVQIPLGDSTPDLLKLVRTAMGDGQVERMSINLSSRMAKTTLKYDTYAEE